VRGGRSVTFVSVVEGRFKGLRSLIGTLRMQKKVPEIEETSDPRIQELFLTFEQPTNQ